MQLSLTSSATWAIEVPEFPVSRRLGIRMSSVEVVKGQKKLHCAATPRWRASPGFGSPIAQLLVLNPSASTFFFPCLLDLSLSPFGELSWGRIPSRGERKGKVLFFCWFNMLKWVNIESIAYQRPGKESAQNHWAWDFDITEMEEGKRALITARE